MATRRRVSLSLALVAALVIVSTVFLYPYGRTGREAQATTGSTYSLLQMNLCLSGRAACFPGVFYPLGMHEAIARILDSQPDAVTLNEVCSGDVANVAQATGYQLRFAHVRSHGALLPCQTPSGRGLYGIAVLTKASIVSSVGKPFEAQDGVEERHWLCATTADTVTVCATHLDIRGWMSVELVNDEQCREFAQVLKSLIGRGPLIAAGDMNRPSSCAPTGMWIRSDVEATRAAGMQQVYGNGEFASPSTRLVHLAFTDHEGLLVTSRLVAR